MSKKTIVERLENIIEEYKEVEASLDKHKKEIVSMKKIIEQVIPEVLLSELSEETVSSLMLIKRFQQLLGNNDYILERGSFRFLKFGVRDDILEINNIAIEPSVGMRLVLHDEFGGYVPWEEGEDGLEIDVKWNFYQPHTKFSKAGTVAKKYIGSARYNDDSRPYGYIIASDADFICSTLRLICLLESHYLQYSSQKDSEYALLLKTVIQMERKIEEDYHTLCNYEQYIKCLLSDILVDQNVDGLNISQFITDYRMNEQKNNAESQTTAKKVKVI